MTTLTFHIGGKMVRTLSEWFYVGGKIIEDMHDPDLLSFFTILERCAAFGYKNIGKVWYEEHSDGLGLRETLNSFSGDNSFMPFITYALENNVVHIYVEHNDVTHPFFDAENPKNLCENLGISDHGVRQGGTSGSNKDKNVIDECDEYDGYVSEYGDSDYECDDNDEVGNDYWVDCPYLSIDEDEEFLLHREKKKNIKSRRQKKRVDVSGPGVGNVGGPRLEREEGDVGGPRLEREEGDVGGPWVEREEGNIDGSEEFVDELRREMRRRAHVHNTEAEVSEESNDLSFDSGSEGSFLTSSSGSEAEHAVRIKHTRPRFKEGEQIPQFSVCMVFPNKGVFMKNVISHAIHFRRDVRFIQNDKKRCRAVCKQSECEWRILCSIDGRSGQWMVKTYFGQHTCQKQHHISCLNYKILADWFIHRLRRLTLKLSLVEMRDHFKDQTKINVSKGLCRNAKMKVIAHYIGDPLKEFARLEDYVAELNRSNPGSTVVLEAPDGVFKRMYVCFDGVRKGFNTACRKIIGLDGCFLKGPFRGEILSAIGRDANDQIFPIAWAVVGYEDKETWKWFLDLLMVDLDVAGGNYVYASDGAPIIARGGGFTFMSDQQKGLLLAIAELMPSAVHRRCARHIFAKWRRQHCSDDLHRQFWVICKASTPAEFLDELEVLGSMSTIAMNDFLEVSPTFWCKAFQNTSPCCDIVDNNMSESFNSLIMESRYKSIVKLFETIRKLVFRRYKERKVFVGKFKDGFGPNIWKKINANMEESLKYYVDCNGDDGFEVHLDEDTSWIVSLEKSTCTCRMWELNGIPCAHAVCVIVKEKNTLDVKGFVSKWYTQEMFEMAYKDPIKPVHCKRFWPRLAATPIKPPTFTKFPGRPKKLRRREAWEPAVGGTKMSRKGRKMSCSFCRQSGHLSNTCLAKAGGAPVESAEATIEAAEAGGAPMETAEATVEGSEATVEAAKAGGAPMETAEATVEAAEAGEAPMEAAEAAASTNEIPDVIMSMQNNVVQRRNHVCSFCKMEGHRKNTCALNPTSKRFIAPNSQVSGSQPPPVPLPATQVSDRTQVLLQELRQTCGTSRGRKKSDRRKGKLPSGLGCFVAESGYTCYDPNTPRQRVIDVPARRKSKRLASVGAAATSK